MKHFLLIISLFIVNNALANFPISFLEKPEKNVLRDSTTIEWTKDRDPRTGYEVWQITNAKTPSVACYFEAQAFTADDRYIVFRSNRFGSSQLFRADLTSGVITRLTNAEQGAGSFTIHPDGRNAYFVDGWALEQVDVPTAHARTVIDFKGKLSSRPRFSASFTSDGNYTVVTNYDEEKKEIVTSLVSLSTGKLKTVFRWSGHFSHPQICPSDPDLITFVPGPDTQNDMSLPMEKRARTWIVDVRTGKPRQFLTAPYGSRATHESWSPDGKRFFFYQKTRPGWSPVSICSIDKNGGDWRVHYTNENFKLGHGRVSPDGRWFITDVQKPYNNPLMLIEIATGKAEILCWPDASTEGGHRKQAHVHPSFSSTGRYVCYTSDRTGIPQVYVVPIPKVLWNQSK